MPATFDASTVTIVLSIFGTGIVLAVLILRQGARLDSRIDRLENRLNERMDRLEYDHADLRERMARIEGMIDGLREAVTAVREAAAAVREAFAERRRPEHVGAD